MLHDKTREERDERRRGRGRPAGLGKGGAFAAKAGGGEKERSVESDGARKQAGDPGSLFGDFYGPSLSGATCGQRTPPVFLFCLLEQEEEHGTISLACFFLLLLSNTSTNARGLQWKKKHSFL